MREQLHQSTIQRIATAAQKRAQELRDEEVEMKGFLGAKYDHDSFHAGSNGGAAYALGALAASLQLHVSGELNNYSDLLE
jgi:hypothetical protein